LAGQPFVGQRATLGEVDLVDRRRDLGQLPARAMLEQRDAPKRLDLRVLLHTDKTPGGAGLFLRKPLGERVEHLQLEAGKVAEERAERLRREDEQTRRLGGRDRGSPL